MRDLVMILLAIFLPPVAAFLKEGVGLHFWVNLVLTICFVFPGSIHAVWLLLRKS